MPINDKGFIICPKCSRVTKTKVHKETVLKKFPLFCTWCKEETIIDYEPEPRASAITL